MQRLEIRNGLYQIPLPGTAAFLVDGGEDGGILVDAGRVDCAAKIVGSIGSHGMDVEQVKHILVTHLHADHTGSLAELQRLTGAQVYMHKADADLIESGRALRRVTVSPGLINGFLARPLRSGLTDAVESVPVDVLVHDRDVLPIAGGIEVIHTPGHTEGHCVYLSHRHRAAFMGDAAATLLGLREMPVNEHFGQAVMSLKKLAGYDFDIACFAHGESIRRGASAKFQKRWHRGR